MAEKSEARDLPGLEQFYGTEQYHNVMGVNVTDGIMYIMENGYSWFVTDMLVILKMKLKDAEFCSVKLKLSDGGAKAIIDDGNDNVLYTQDYELTDAERELTLFFTDGVLMLSGEY